MPTEYVPTHRRYASDALPNRGREGRSLVPPSPDTRRPSRERSTDTRYRRTASPAGPRGLVSQDFLERSANQIRQRTTSASELRRLRSRDAPLDGTRHVSYQYRAPGQDYIATAERREDIPEMQPRVRRDGVGQPARYQENDPRSGLRPLALARQYPQTRRTPSTASLRQTSGAAQPTHARSTTTLAHNAPRQVSDSRRVRFEDLAAGHRRTFSTPDPRPTAPQPASNMRSSGAPPGYPSGTTPTFMNMPPIVPGPAQTVEQHPVTGATVSRSASTASSAAVNHTRRMAVYDPLSTTDGTAVSPSVGHSSHGGARQPQEPWRSHSGRHLTVPQHRPDVPSIAREFSTDSETQDVTPSSYHVRRASEQRGSRNLPAPPAQTASNTTQTTTLKRSPSYRKPVPQFKLQATQPPTPASAARQPAKNPSKDSLASTASSSSLNSLDAAQVAQLQHLITALATLGVGIEDAHRLRDDPAFLTHLASAIALSAPSRSVSEESLPRTPVEEAPPAWIVEESGKTPTKATFAHDATRAPRVLAEDPFADVHVDKSLPPTPARTSPVEGKSAVQRKPSVRSKSSSQDSSGFSPPHVVDVWTPRKLEGSELQKLINKRDVGCSENLVGGNLSYHCNYKVDNRYCGSPLTSVADWEIHRAIKHGIMPERDLVCAECGANFKSDAQAKATHACTKLGQLTHLLSKALSFTKSATNEASA